MVIPRGAAPTNKKESKDQDPKKSKKKKKSHFDGVLDDLESYEEDCKNRSLMDST